MEFNLFRNDSSEVFLEVDIMINRFGNTLVDERDLPNQDNYWNDHFD